MSTTTTTLKRDLPAREVDRRLRAAVAELRRAERSAVLWFAEVLTRKLYRELGFGSIYQYAEVALGFGPGKTAQFIRLAGALRDLPRLAESVARGEVTWTQARTVAAVATPETEAAWLAAAKGTSSRGLEHQVRVARRLAARARARKGQLGPQRSTEGGASRVALPGPEDEGTGRMETTNPPPVPPVGSLPLPRSVQLRFSPEQGARYEALLEAARKQGIRGDKAELLLAGLEALVTANACTRVPNVAAQGDLEDRDQGDGGEPKRGDTCADERQGDDGKGAGSSGRAPNRVFASPYQVLVQLCPSCAGGSVVTARGQEPLHPNELKAILCDARVRRPGERNKTVIPARVRREVLERDGHRCRSAGCGSARFLAVHHKTPREAGGTNDPENLVTLCAACHRAIHVYTENRPTGPPVGARRPPSRSRQDHSGAGLEPARAGPSG